MLLCRLLPLATLLVLTSTSVARAQIYAWRDANGRLVLSDRPLSRRARTYAVAGSTTFRTTKAPPRRVSALYDDLIREQAVLHGVRADLIRAVIQVESGYNPRARSRAGALGLMQLMPLTAVEFGVRSPFDPAQNIRGGVAYLKHLLTKYGSNEELALAAYNAGPTAVDRYGTRVPPYAETRNYVQKVKAIDGNVRTGGKGRVIYKTYEVVDGRRVPRYTDVKPRSGPYEVITSGW